MTRNFSEAVVGAGYKNVPFEMVEGIDISPQRFIWKFGETFKCQHCQKDNQFATIYNITRIEIYQSEDLKKKVVFGIDDKGRFVLIPDERLSEFEKYLKG